LTDASLDQAVLSEARIDDAQMHGASLTGANFFGCGLGHAKDAPVIIDWLDWRAHIYEDRAEIGCVVIRRHFMPDEIWWENDDARVHLKYKSLLTAIWETAFPESA
jgi:uncharacterized protein YjbI with pentapeptide repeats